MKYFVVTDHSSKEEVELDYRGRQILFKTNNFQQARKECIQWAAWDDIPVLVLNRYGNEKFICTGAYEAETRYPVTAYSTRD